VIVLFIWEHEYLVLGLDSGPLIESRGSLIYQIWFLLYVDAAHPMMDLRFHWIMLHRLFPLLKLIKGEPFLNGLGLLRGCDIDWLSDYAIVSWCGC
jgi:hypothetical protein